MSNCPRLKIKGHEKTYPPASLKGDLVYAADRLLVWTTNGRIQAAE